MQKFILYNKTLCPLGGCCSIRIQQPLNWSLMCYVRNHIGTQVFTLSILQIQKLCLINLPLSVLNKVKLYKKNTLKSRRNEKVVVYLWNELWEREIIYTSPSPT